jgi:hypothetical protein
LFLLPAYPHPQKIHRNIFRKWHFLSREKPPHKTPQKTTHSPQIHHKKPPRKHTKSPKPPVKSTVLLPK